MKITCSSERELVISKMQFLNAKLLFREIFLFGFSLLNATRQWHLAAASAIGLCVGAGIAGAAAENARDGTPSSDSIAIATDKTKYRMGDLIKIQVTNRLGGSAWYIGYPQRDLRFWEIERAQGDGWKRLQFRLPLLEGTNEVCRTAFYERPIGMVTELKPHSRLDYEWNQKICVTKTGTSPFEPEIIDRGRYRFSLRYSLRTVKTEDFAANPWKRPIELGETKVIYSNEFGLE